MTLLHKIELWGDRHHPKWLDIIRIALGIFLCYKGIDFLQNMGSLTSRMTNKADFGSFNFLLLGQYIVFAHLLGGLMIITGFYTRIACLFQIPILLVAVLFINTGNEMIRPYSEFFISLIILILLIYFLIIGNGSWSVKIHNEDENHEYHP